MMAMNNQGRFASSGKYDRMMLIFASVLATSPAGHAALAGAWDGFGTEDHVDGWSVEDFADNGIYVPFWEPGDDPFIYSFHTDDEPQVFFTGLEEFAGGGAFVGDYFAAGIRAIRVDAFIDWPEDLFELDCAILATGPGGRRYYYSEPYLGEDFEEDGWWSLNFAFDEDWYYLDGGLRVTVAVTREMLESIEEIGFGFYPRTGALGLEAAIDNVRLEPYVTAPLVDTAVENGEFTMTFTPRPGNACFVQKYRMASPQGWSLVPGQQDITGGEHVFRVPVTPGSGIFRVGSDAHYTLIGPP